MSIEEIISEDFGFKVTPDAADDGLPIFKSGIDLEEFGTEDLHLFDITNTTGHFVISNGSSIKLDQVSKLDSDFTPETFQDLDISSNSRITQVYFNSHGNEVYIINNSKLQLIRIGGNHTIETHNAATGLEIKSILPSSCNTLAVLTTSHDLYTLNGTSLTQTSSSVASFAWSRTGELHYITRDSLHIHSQRGDTIPLALSDEDAEELENYRSVFIKELGDSSWFAVYESNDSELDDHMIKSYVISKTSGEYVTNQTEIADPFGGVARALSYYSPSLVNWIGQRSVHFLTSSLVSDWGALSINGNEITTVAPAEDTFRATFPLDEETSDDLTPIGAALDLTRNETVVNAPCPGIDQITGLPKLYTFLNNGKLISWWIIDKEAFLNNEADLTRALNAVKASESVAPALITPTNNIDTSKVDNITDTFSGTDIDLSSTGTKPAVKQSGLSGDSLGTSENPQSNPFGTSTSNPFGSSSSNAFKTSFGLGKSDISSAALKPEDKLVSSNESKPAGGFGQIAFGQPLNSSSTGQSGFGKTSFGQASFGSTSFGQAGYQKAAQNKSAPLVSSNFGSYGNSSNSSQASPFASTQGTSPFGTVQNKESPFGEPAKSSPFGSLLSDSSKADNSPFGESSSKASPFGNVSATDSQKKSGNSSPFANMQSSQEPSKSTSFGSFQGSQEPAKSSPFASLQGPQEPVKSSPFGKPAGTKAEESPFARLSQPQSTTDKPKSLFGGSQSSTADAQEPKESPFAGLSKPVGNADKPKGSLFDNSQKPAGDAEPPKAPAFGDSGKVFSHADAAKGSPFAKLDAPNVEENKKPFSFGNLQKETPNQEQEPSSSPAANGMSAFSFGSFGKSLSEKPAAEPENTKPEPASLFGAGKSHKLDNARGLGLGSESKSLFSSKSATKDASGAKPTSASQDAPEPEKSEPKDLSAETVTSSEHSDADFDDEDQSDAESFVEVGDEEYVEVHKPVNHEERPESELTEDEHRDLQLKCLLSSEKFKPGELQIYAGLTEPVKNANPIAQKILQIINDTDGHFAVLEHNFAELKRQIELQEADPGVEMWAPEVLDYADHWRFAHLDDFMMFVTELTESAQARLEKVTQQDHDLTSVVESLVEVQTGRAAIDMLFAQAQALQDFAANKNVFERSLDLPNETLQTSLRRKMRRVQALENELVARMMPLKARALDEGVVRKLERAVYEVNQQTRARVDEIGSLAAQVSGLTVSGRSAESSDAGAMVVHRASSKNSTVAARKWEAGRRVRARVGVVVAPEL